MDRNPCRDDRGISLVHGETYVRLDSGRWVERFIRVSACRLFRATRPTLSARVQETSRPSITVRTSRLRYIVGAMLVYLVQTRGYVEPVMPLRTFLNLNCSWIAHNANGRSVVVRPMPIKIGTYTVMWALFFYLLTIPITISEVISSKKYCLVSALYNSFTFCIIQ